MARNLQECLALANFKAQNGWQDRTLRAIEPEFTEHLKRKRPYYSDDVSSDSCSIVSENGQHNPSPSKTPVMSHERPSTSYHVRAPPAVQQIQHAASAKRLRANSTMASIQRPIRNVTWKRDHRLAQSSPVGHHPQPIGSFGRGSFVSDSATIPESTSSHSPIFDIQNVSDEDEADLPMHSFSHRASSSMISSSPPRTPPPNRSLRNGTSKESGADLLLYLANSPSRSPAANHARLLQLPQQPPSTPPSQHTHLPSSVMNTPGANVSLFNGAFNTPGQGFNFADFVNVTPSPAQLPWGGRTPTARTARRGLNFDALAPPTGHSPLMQRKTPTSKGLALELGEELMPRS